MLSCFNPQEVKLNSSRKRTSTNNQDHPLRTQMDHLCGEKNIVPVDIGNCKWWFSPLSNVEETTKVMHFRCPFSVNILLFTHSTKVWFTKGLERIKGTECQQYYPIPQNTLWKEFDLILLRQWKRLFFSNKKKKNLKVVQAYLPFMCNSNKNESWNILPNQ